MELPESELLLIVSDMETWWNRGASATSEAQMLGNLIKAHLESRLYTEEGDTLYAMPDEMMARLVRVMFHGPTEAIREAARQVLHDYTAYPTPISDEDPDHA